MHSLPPEHQRAQSTTPDDWTCYCVLIRVTLGQRRCDQPPPSHAWNGSLIANILQEACPGDQITKSVVLVPGEAILFFRRCSCKEGLLYSNVQDIEHGLKGPVNWAGRITQVEVTINTMQKVTEPLQMPLQKIEQRPEGLGAPKGQGELPCHWLPPVILMNGCKA